MVLRRSAGGRVECGIMKFYDVGQTTMKYLRCKSVDMVHTSIALLSDENLTFICVLVYYITSDEVVQMHFTKILISKRRSFLNLIRLC